MKLVPEIREDVLKGTFARARERNIILPTFAQHARIPALAPAQIRSKLKKRYRPVGPGSGQPVPDHLEK